MTVTDSLIELSSGTTGGAPTNDAGIIIERGDLANAFLGWDESEDKFIVGTTTADGSASGNLTITTGTLVANVEGNVTGNVSGTAATVTGAAQAAITSVGTLSALAVDNLSLDANTMTTTSGDLNLSSAGALNITPAIG